MPGKMRGVRDQPQCLDQCRGLLGRRGGDDGRGVGILERVSTMKRLQIALLSVSIFAVGAFGINECAILAHKANTSGLWRNIQVSWNHSLAETGKELNDANNAFTSLSPAHGASERWGMSDQWKQEHPRSSIVDWSLSNPPMAELGKHGP